jgi:thymidylate synthase (FAD)
MIVHMPDGIGMVELYDWMHMHPPLKAVNMARGSFGKRVQSFDKSRHVRFLDHLAQEFHTAPMRHTLITLYVQAPEVVARQWWKHIVGGDYSFKDTGWSELSGRYVPYEHWYTPKEFHVQPQNKKSGRSPEIHHRSNEFVSRYQELIKQSFQLYQDMVDSGVAYEQARMHLPLSTYTYFYWTASGQALNHFVKLRRKHDAQAEIRVFADAVDSICRVYYGEVWDSMETFMN